LFPKVLSVGDRGDCGLVGEEDTNELFWSSEFLISICEFPSAGPVKNVSSIYYTAN
jgi:hypothetical protein